MPAGYFIALIAVLAIWQRDNLTALYMFYTKSGQELEETVVWQSALEQQNALEQYGKITVRDLSPEEEAELVNGTITPPMKSPNGLAGLPRTENPRMLDLPGRAVPLVLLVLPRKRPPSLHRRRTKSSTGIWRIFIR